MIKRSMAIAWLSGCAAMAFMATSTSAAELLEAVKASIQKHMPELQVEQLQGSPVKGLYHAVIGGSSGYVTADGRYFISGDMIDVQQRTNLTEEGRKKKRLELIGHVAAADAIIFAPQSPQHTITVFTDVDCGYCRKLHSEIARYNELGIAVRYVAFPRTGPGSESWTKMESVWCSANRRDAITRAKLGEDISKPANCGPTQVKAQFELGEKIGVQGTPTIVLADGSVIGGYMPPADLAQSLQSAKTAVGQ